MQKKNYGARRLRHGIAVTLAAGLVAGTAATAGAVPAPPRPPRLPARPAPTTTVPTCAQPGSGYGRMFANLPAATWETSALDALSRSVMSPAGPLPVPGTPDAEENRAIAAGYTYFGQFVDHDLTKDDRPTVLLGTIDVSTLTNGRTPQLDLDSVYGKGPTGSPQLYSSDQVHLLVGAPLTGSPDKGARDLPRDPASGMALVGDLRNDENRMVAAVHSAFLRFHNQTVDQLWAANPTWTATQVLAQARSTVVRTYQQIVVEDFLPTIVNRPTVDAVVRATPRGWTTSLRWYSTCQQMPVEFAGAAYRFGHSMVRSGYRLNTSTPVLPVFSGTFVPGSDVSGFSPSPSSSAVDWNLFLPVALTTPAALRPAPPRNPAATPGPGAGVQWAYRPDVALTSSLGLLPLPPTDAGSPSLALRNLLRGRQLGLPSGQAVARAMGVTPLRDDQILVGAATGTSASTVALSAVDPSFAGSAPLWAYVLAEATAEAYPVSGGKIVGPQKSPFRLGPVGGRIVVETVVGLLASDPTSILHQPAPTPVRGQRVQPHLLRELLDQVASQP